MLKSTPYTVMEVEVGIPDNKPFEGEPARWGADEGTRLEDLELEVCVCVFVVVHYVRVCVLCLCAQCVEVLLHGIEC